MECKQTTPTRAQHGGAHCSSSVLMNCVIVAVVCCGNLTVRHRTKSAAARRRVSLSEPSRSRRKYSLKLPEKSSSSSSRKRTLGTTMPAQICGGRVCHQSRLALLRADRKQLFEADLVQGMEGRRPTDALHERWGMCHSAAYTSGCMTWAGIIFRRRTWCIVSPASKIR
jgi:hypothetical protein